MYDALLVAQASVTKTSTFNSTAVNLPAGTLPWRPLIMRVVYSAATNASGSNSVTFSVDESADNSTFYQLVNDAREVINLSTTAQSGELLIPFVTTQPYVRLTCTIAGGGSTPTVTYFGDIGLAKP